MSGTYHRTPLEPSSHQNLIDEDDYPSTTQISSTTSQATFPLQSLQPAVAPTSFRPQYYQQSEGDRNSLTLASLNPYYNDAPDDEEEHEQFYSDQSGLMRQISNMSDANLPLTEHAASTSPNVTEIQGLMGGKSGGNSGNGGNGDDNVGRTVYINDPTRNAPQKFIHNKISTAKYNFVTFLPKFLYEQFSKYANLFFLFTGIVLLVAFELNSTRVLVNSQIKNVSPTNRYTTLGPLIVVLSATAFKEILEDYVGILLHFLVYVTTIRIKSLSMKRHKSDSEVNSRECQALQGSQFLAKEWNNVKVGDIVRVENGEFFPADLVLLSSSEPEGLCYIETSNLDGETNLKIKQAPPETAESTSALEISRLNGYLKSEQPNNSLYTYEGTLYLSTQSGQKKIPLDPTQILLRGAQLRNTNWVYGLVVFTGHETKLMRNASATPIKRTNVEKTVNVQIIFLFCILLAMSLACSIGSVIRVVNFNSEMSYLFLLTDQTVLGQFGFNILTFLILFNNLIPISLIVTMEVVKFQQASLINNDLDMYYEKTDTPALCRTSSLVEELGQIEYIFSDKTGTLTCNEMEFRQCSIAGIAYADVVEESKKARIVDGAEVGMYDFNRLCENLKNHPTANVINEFLTLLAVCHTVIPEKDEKNETGEIVYQASSPDEGALVKGAANLKYTFTTRRPKSVSITANGTAYDYEILNICEFNSTRKRMSTVVRCSDGKIKLYCKGADTVILERLSEDNPFVEQTLQHLEDYATEGLRTLCIAMREISEEEYKVWSGVYDKASTTLVNRQEELDKAAEMIEKNLFLLGATAIEDKLQDGVPETIHTLQQAGIKIWVLTGDRQETAINIGLSCKLISEDMSLIIVNEENRLATQQFLEKKILAIKGRANADTEPLALVIDGRTLEFALEKDLEKSFLELATLCKAVICCRVSPLQKALVVKLVKRHLKAILLAIGDGANDVSMIQAAHVGVGISGLEGLQAARSADVAISQFRYLKKLLLVHGAWSYQRLSKLILYSFYKNITLYMTQFWFAFHNSFSGQVIYESWTISYYNVLFTVLPPIVIGVFDQYVSARMLDRYPQMYQVGQTGEFFNVKSFWGWTVNAFYHSLVLYFCSIYIFSNDLMLPNGLLAGHWVWGTTLYTAVLLTVLGKAALVTDLWTKYTYIAIPGSFIFWLVFLPIYAMIAPKLGVSEEYEGIVPMLFGTPVFYLTVLLLPTICLLRDYVWKYAKRMYSTRSYHTVQEIQKYNIPDYRPRMEQFQKAIRKVRAVQRLRRNRGFAFSQNESGQETRIIRAYDTTLKKPTGL
ncbi:5339_t:CDS:10 [Paraglomus brasilianum]|uniref:Phospholipid-transporting ATPase n=1 Tax=Paraglomus brasilianum TaxID=144538 RepID=A0A9N9AD11_9GLOM|nr:5339_t:CDS:10 [Paraglomus brasilianum]